MTILGPDGRPLRPPEREWDLGDPTAWELVRWLVVIGVFAVVGMVLG